MKRMISLFFIIYLVQILSGCTNPASNLSDTILDDDPFVKFIIEYSIDSGLNYTTCSEYSFIPANTAYFGYLIPEMGLYNVRLKNIGNVILKIKVRREYDWSIGGGNWEVFNGWESVGIGDFSLVFTDMSGENSMYYFLVDTQGYEYDMSMNTDFGLRYGTTIIQSIHNAINTQPIMIGKK